MQEEKPTIPEKDKKPSIMVILDELTNHPRIWIFICLFTFMMLITVVPALFLTFGRSTFNF